jgi:hypothetical protein
MLHVTWREKISLLLVFALVLFAMPIARTSAARPDSLKAVLSDSRKATNSMYTITLDEAAGTTLASGETVTVTFPSGFTVPTFVAADTTFTDNSVSKTVQDAACGATNTVRVTVSGQVVTFTACSSYTGGTGTNIVMTLGTSSNKVTNHSTAATYQLAVFGTYGDDTQDTAIVITDGVTVSATVDETASLTVAGDTTGNCPNPIAAGTETEIDTSGSAITVPFGTVSTEAFYGACQKLTSGTNAQLGYNTTVQTTSLMTSGSNTIAKGTCDGACSDSTKNTWATATNNGMGYCMSDSSGDAAVTADSGWSGGSSASDHGCNATGSGVTQFKTIANAGASQTAQTIMSSAAPVSGDVSYIKYRLSADAAQAAGAYSTTVVYIMTGNF